MKIGILGHGFIGWGGGIDFLRIVADSLQVADPNIELHFIFPISGPLYQTRLHLSKLKRAVFQTLGFTHPAYKPTSLLLLNDLVASLKNKAYVHQIDLGMSALRNFSKKQRLDVLLPAINPLKSLPIPWMGYLYDYQHEYYPQYFTTNAIATRRRQFSRMLLSASHVIVNAQSVADDISTFNPEHKAEIIKLPFSAAPNPSWFEQDVVNLEGYKIAKPYFIICNQFWQHKDHSTAWKALAKVLKFYPEINLVCTGATQDYRNPDYFPNLMNLANKLGVSQNISILGLIPKNDQIGLMRSSVALIQPTLFEGGPGGGSVFDAVSLGVQCIVSDIKVNQELSEDHIHFFKAGDPISLSHIMISLLNKSIEYQSLAPVDLIEKGIFRRRHCGEKLINAIKALQN